VIDEFDIPDLLVGLVAKSLVVLDDDTGRYRLYETVRQYAGARLKEDGEEEELKQRHFRWSVDLAREAQPHLDGPEMQVWLDRLDTEHVNIRTALAHAPTEEERLELAIDVHRFWFVRGYLTEGREWLEGPLREGAGADPMRRAKALNCAGILAWRKGDLRGAHAAFSESLELRLANSDQSGSAAVLNNLGLVADDEGDLPAGRGYYEQAVQIYRQLDDRRRIGMVLANLSANLIELGEYDAAEGAAREYLSIPEDARDPWCTGTALENLAEIKLRTGNAAGAAALSRKALQLMADLADEAQILHLLTLCSQIALEEGSIERAVVLMAASEAFAETEAVQLRKVGAEVHEKAKLRSRTLLSAERFAACWERGRRMPADEAIRLVLSESEPGC
jgi:tetratricopeptide (TPR) repeat protein